MSALRELLETFDINDMTCLQFAIFKLNQINQGQAIVAAEELAAKDAEIARLKAEQDLSTVKTGAWTICNTHSRAYAEAEGCPWCEIDRLKESKAAHEFAIIEDAPEWKRLTRIEEAAKEGTGWENWANNGGGWRDAFKGWLKSVNDALGEKR